MPPAPGIGLPPIVHVRPPTRWTSSARRALWLVIALVMLASAQIAAATTKQALLVSPIAGALTSSPLENPPHHIHFGDWAADIAAGAGTPVHARFGASNGALSLAIVETSPESCANGRVGGARVTVRVHVDGVHVADVRYLHLAGVRGVGPLPNGAQIGVLAGGLPENELCWTGPHVHIEPRNPVRYSCFRATPLGTGLDGGSVIGVVGGEWAGGAHQTCPAQALSVGAQPPPPPPPDPRLESRNLLRDGGFEGGGIGWDHLPPAPGVTTSRAVYQNPALAHNGTGFMQANTAADGGSIYQDVGIGLAAGESASFSIWLRQNLDNPHPAPSASVCLWSLPAGQNSCKTVTLTKQWQPVQVTATMPSTTTVLRAQVYMAGRGNFDFDGAVLGAPPVQSLLAGSENPAQAGVPPMLGPGAVAVAPSRANRSRSRARRCKVPALRGITVHRAKARLTRAGCRLGAVKKVRAKGVAHGRVLRVPAAGRTLPVRARVTIVVRR